MNNFFGEEYQPVFFKSVKDANLTKLKKDPSIVQNDLFLHCLNELFDIEHPWLKAGNPVYQRTYEAFINQWRQKGEFESQGVWVYYPWTRSLLHLPPSDIYIRLRRSRNRNLITEEEQEIIRSKTIGIAGMSVGSNILNTLVLTSGPGRLRIADFDEISVPNLNRIMAPAQAVGLNKAVYFARRAYEVDPFLEVKAFSGGLGEESFVDFFEKPKLDIFIEEMDSPYLKIQSRKYARKLGIPVIMAADNGDGVLIDVERFDLEPRRPLFHGWLDHMDLDNISPELTFAQKLTIIADMVRLEQAETRAQDSLEDVGTVLNTWPQLGTAALMAGVALTFVARRILLGLPMPSGRYAIGLEEHLVPGFNSVTARADRQNHTVHIMKNFRSFQNFIEEVVKI